CEVGVESTIVDATGDTLAILRPGGVTRESLEAVLGFPLAVPETSTVRVPGQHPSHYAPRARVILVEPDEVVAEAARVQEEGHRARARSGRGARASPAPREPGVLGGPPSRRGGAAGGRRGGRGGGHGAPSPPPAPWPGTGRRRRQGSPGQPVKSAKVGTLFL